MQRTGSGPLSAVCDPLLLLRSLVHYCNNITSSLNPRSESNCNFDGTFHGPSSPCPRLPSTFPYPRQWPSLISCSPFPGFPFLNIWLLLYVFRQLKIYLGFFNLSRLFCQMHLCYCIRHQRDRKRERQTETERERRQGKTYFHELPWDCGTWPSLKFACKVDRFKWELMVQFWLWLLQASKLETQAGFLG